MKKFFYLIWIVLFSPCSVWAVGSGESIEGDSSSVTITLNNARDSVWLRFASPDDNFYDSVKAVPLTGTSHKILIAPYLNLDSIGGHLIVAFTFTGDAVAETVVGTWLHENPNYDPTGTGDNTVIIYVKDDSDSTGISGYQIDIEDSTGGELKAGYQTQSGGACTLSLATSVYSVAMSKTPYTITTPIYPSIDSDTTLTYYATLYSPSAPPADTLCVVYVYVKTNQGVAIPNAKVSIWGEASNVKYGNIVIDYQKRVTEKTGSDGKAEFAEGFYPNDTLTPNDLYYHYRIETTYSIAEGTFEIPVANSYELVIEQ